MGPPALPQGAVAAVASGVMDGRITSRATGAAAGSPPCDAAACITCSDAAVTCRVLEVDGAGLARVEVGSEQETVSVALVDARPGDTVLVHAGEAIAVVGA